MKPFLLTLKFAKHPQLELTHSFQHEPTTYFTYQDVEFIRVLFDKEKATAVYRERV